MPDLPANTLFALQTSFGVGLGFVILWLQCPSQLGAWVDVMLAAMLGGLIGARLEYIALHAEFFAEYPSQVVQMWAGSLEWHGALVGGGLCAYGMARRRRIELGQW